MSDRLRDSWEWLAFAASLPAQSLQLGASQASGQLLTGRCILTGVNLWNTATVAGSLAIHDGTTQNGNRVYAADVAASASLCDVLGTTGVFCEIGLYLRITGIVPSGAVYFIPLWHYPDTLPGT